MKKNILEKKKLNKNVKEEKAITLIALVITILVLLILAGVTILMLTGENGILKKATTAKERTAEAQNEENATLEGYDNLINDSIGTGGTSEKLSAEMISFTPQDTNWNVENVKEALDYLYNN